MIRSTKGVAVLGGLAALAMLTGLGGCSTAAVSEPASPLIERIAELKRALQGAVHAYPDSAIAAVAAEPFLVDADKWNLDAPPPAGLDNPNGGTLLTGSGVEYLTFVVQAMTTTGAGGTYSRVQRYACLTATLDGAQVVIAVENCDDRVVAALPIDSIEVDRQTLDDGAVL